MCGIIAVILAGIDQDAAPEIHQGTPCEVFPSVTQADTSKRCTTFSTVDRMLAVSPHARAVASSSNAKATDLRPKYSTMVSV
jgi:hypothetical protein